MISNYNDKYSILVQNTPGFLIPGQDYLLFELARQIPDKGIIVEIGSFLGKSTIALALGAADKRPKIYAIDTFKGNSNDFKNGLNNVQWEGDNFLNEFKSNLKKANITTVEPIQGYSHDIGAKWNKSIDLLFIDASHDFDDIEKDYELFSPWVRPGGIVALHDVAPQWKGPYKIWNDRVRHELTNPKQFFSLAYGLKKSLASLHIIIPVHNTINQTLGCLKSLHQSTIIDKCAIYVVDDGSTDGTREKLKENYPEVTVIKGDGTLYWTGAVALALSELKKTISPESYFCLINNDVRVSPETLEVLLKDVKLQGKNACIAPVAYNGLNAEPTGWGPGTARIFNNFSNQITSSFNTNIFEVDALYGRCSLFPKSILESVGNYDSKAFPHYHGDTDFCLRAKKKGFRFFISASTCLSVVVNKNTTGSHFEFQKNAHKWKEVWNNMTSIKSIDNVRYFYRFVNRHHPKNKYKAVIYKIWSSVAYWHPIYVLRKVKRNITNKLKGVFK